MSLNGGAWLDRSAWAPRFELLPYRRRVPQRKKKVKNAKKKTRFVFPDNVIAELFRRLGSFIFGCVACAALSRGSAGGGAWALIAKRWVPSSVGFCGEAIN